MKHDYSYPDYGTSIEKTPTGAYCVSFGENKKYVTSLRVARMFALNPSQWDRYGNAWSRTRHGEIDGIPVRVVYRVRDDHNRPTDLILAVTEDGRIWIGLDDAQQFSHVASAESGLSRERVCSAARVN